MNTPHKYCKFTTCQYNIEIQSETRPAQFMSPQGVPHTRDSHIIVECVARYCSTRHADLHYFYYGFALRAVGLINIMTRARCCIFYSRLVYIASIR